MTTTDRVFYKMEYGKIQFAIVLLECILLYLKCNIFTYLDTAYWKHFFETDIGLRKAEIITAYAEKFESQGITKKILLEDITEVDLEKLDIAMGHRKLIIRHIKVSKNLYFVNQSFVSVIFLQFSTLEKETTILTC